MSNVEKFNRDGKLVLNVNYEANEGSQLICVEKGLWYKFKIEKVEELEDHTFNITTTKLIGIDNTRISD